MNNDESLLLKHCSDVKGMVHCWLRTSVRKTEQDPRKSDDREQGLACCVGQENEIRFKLKSFLVALQNT